jgi:hypothetical protein
MHARSGMIWLAASLMPAGGVCACGGSDSAAPRGSTQPQPASLDDCQAVGSSAGATIHLCFEPEGGEHGRFIVETGSTLRELPISPPGPTASASDAGKAGHWAWAALSPDRTTILAQWSAECEVPIAFLAKAGGGSPRPVTGEDDWTESPESVALGWTTDGRALVFLPKGPACGSGVNAPGVYAYSTTGDGELLVRSKRSPIGASTTPRAVRDVRKTRT